jgi:hypothetical protein
LTATPDGYAVPVIAAFRTTLAMALAVLACWFGTTTMATAEPATAGAADCDQLDLSNLTAVLARAEAVTDVFAGEVRAVEPRTSVGGGEGKANQTGSSTDAPQQDPDTRTTGWQHTIVVKVPFRTALRPGDQALVVTTPLTDENGLGRLKAGDTWLFFASGAAGMDHLVAEACSGSQMLPGGLGADLRNALHDALDGEADDPEMPVTLSAPDDGAGGSPNFGRLAAPGAAVALIGVLGLLLLGRVGARRT